MFRKILFLASIFLVAGQVAFAAQILIPMDQSQKNHLKAYGIAYWILTQDIEVDWLLNYRGGSFACIQHQGIEKELMIRGALPCCN